MSYKATATMRERSTGRQWDVTICSDFPTLKEAQDKTEQFMALYATNGSPVSVVRTQIEANTTRWIKSRNGEWICERCGTTCCYEDKDGKTRPDKMGIRFCPRCGRRVMK